MAERKRAESGKRLISKRDFLAAGGAAIAAGALCTYAPSAATQTAHAQTNPATPPATTLEVFDPTGPVEITQLFAKRLGDLNGKTIALLNSGWEGTASLALVTELLKKRYPTAKIISPTEFGVGKAEEDAPKLINRIKELKPDAVIIGNAG